MLQFYFMFIAAFGKAQASLALLSFIAIILTGVNTNILKLFKSHFEVNLVLFPIAIMAEIKNAKNLRQL